MKLKLVISTTNKTIRLINVDAKNSETSLERDLATWRNTTGQDFRFTTWNNRSINEANPYKYNRVNVHYTNKEGATVTTSYYCIHEVIILESMSFNNFDSSIII